MCPRKRTKSGAFKLNSLTIRTGKFHEKAGKKFVDQGTVDRLSRRFRSPGSTQRFLSAHAAVQNHFNTRRHLISASQHRTKRDRALRAWRLVANAA
jgi:hypothetical protein